MALSSNPNWSGNPNSRASKNRRKKENKKRRKQERREAKLQEALGQSAGTTYEGTQFQTENQHPGEWNPTYQSGYSNDDTSHAGIDQKILENPKSTASSSPMDVSDSGKAHEPITANNSEAIKPGIFNWAKNIGQQIFGPAKPNSETGGMARPKVGKFTNKSLQMKKIYFRLLDKKMANHLRNYDLDISNFNNIKHLPISPFSTIPNNLC